MIASTITIAGLRALGATFTSIPNLGRIYNKDFWITSWPFKVTPLRCKMKSILLVTCTNNNYTMKMTTLGLCVYTSISRHYLCLILDIYGSSYLFNLIDPSSQSKMSLYDIAAINFKLVCFLIL